MATIDLPRSRGMLFSDRLVRAIIQRRKIVTRRLVKPDLARRIEAGEVDPAEVASPYGVEGERLYVREAWADVAGTTVYRATDPDGAARWKPSIHMPRARTRILLEISEPPTVERVQDITVAEIAAEGARVPVNPGGPGGGNVLLRLTRDDDGTPAPVDYLEQPRPAMDWPIEDIIRAHFAALWDGTNGHRPGASWRDNPLVWRVPFRVLAAPGMFS